MIPPRTESMSSCSGPNGDQERNTDLMVLRAENKRIACRVRTAGELAKPGYCDEFTIRSCRPASGSKTELAKIVDGWGDFLFYGFADHDRAGEISHWFLGDLYVFRGWFARELIRCNGVVPGSLKRNGDGSSDFRVFKIAAMPAGFVVDRACRVRFGV